MTSKLVILRLCFHQFNGGKRTVRQRGRFKECRPEGRCLVAGTEREGPPCKQHTSPRRITATWFTADTYSDSRSLKALADIVPWCLIPYPHFRYVPTMPGSAPRTTYIHPGIYIFTYENCCFSMGLYGRATASAPTCPVPEVAPDSICWQLCVPAQGRKYISDETVPGMLIIWHLLHNALQWKKFASRCP